MRFGSGGSVCKKIVLYRGSPSYKRIIVRRVSWYKCHYRNLKSFFKPNWRSTKYWHWNIQLFFVGSEKCNGMLVVRLCNYEIEFGW